MDKLLLEELIAVFQSFASIVGRLVAEQDAEAVKKRIRESDCLPV